MTAKKFRAIFCLLLVLTAEARQEDKQSLKAPPNKQYPSDTENEIDNYRIKLKEPLKLILQTSARFAISQTELPNHMNMESAMKLINEVSYKLSKPKTLFKVIKVVAVTIVSLIVTTIFFPSAGRLLESTWRDPVGALRVEKYLSNGVSEKSVLRVINSIGFNDNTCRQKSLCYAGEVIKCSFPETSESIIKFTSDNFSNSSYKDHKYIKAFLSGFVDRNCSSINVEGKEPTNCLWNLFQGFNLNKS